MASLRVAVAMFLGIVPCAAGSLGAQLTSDAPAFVDAPVILRLPGSTRALGMGDANVALGGDADGIFYNPALLQNARGMGFALQRYGSASTLGTVSMAMALAPGAIGIGVRMLDYGAATASLPFGSATGSDDLAVRGPTFASNTEVVVGYSRPVRNLRAGIAGKFVEQQTGDARDGAVALDVGVTRGSNIVVGAAVQNIGHGLEIAGERLSLAQRATLGAAIPRTELGPFDVAVSSSVSLMREQRWAGGAGAEFSYSPLDGFTFVARGGVQVVHEGGTTRERATVGAGYIGERFQIEYGYQDLGGGHRIGIRWR